MMRVSAEVQGPMPGRLSRMRSTPSVSGAARRALTREVPRAAIRAIVRDCGGSSPARCHSHDGMRRQPSMVGGANIGLGVGPGARVPWPVTTLRQAPHAWRPVTFCSNTELMSASKTRSVRLRRRPGEGATVSLYAHAPVRAPYPAGRSLLEDPRVLAHGPRPLGPNDVLHGIRSGTRRDTPSGRAGSSSPRRARSRSRGAGTSCT